MPEPIVHIKYREYFGTMYVTLLQHHLSLVLP